MDARRLVFGTRRTIAGTVYGTIVVLASLTAGAKAYEHQLWRLDAIVATTVLVLWIAHVYAHGLGESLQLERRLTLGELLTIARREFSIALAAVGSLVAIAFGAIGVLRDNTAVWLAFGLGVASLAVQGIRYSRLERLTVGGTLFTVGVNLALGLALVALKSALAH